MTQVFRDGHDTDKAKNKVTRAHIMKIGDPVYR